MVTHDMNLPVISSHIIYFNDGKILNEQYNSPRSREQGLQQLELNSSDIGVDSCVPLLIL